MLTDADLVAMRALVEDVRYDEDPLPNVLADEMLQLLDEIERLRAALREISEIYDEEYSARVIADEALRPHPA